MTEQDRSLHREPYLKGATVDFLVFLARDFCVPRYVPVLDHAALSLRLLKIRNHSRLRSGRLTSVYAVRSLHVALPDQADLLQYIQL